MVQLGFAMPASIHEILVSVRLEFAEQLETFGYESFWMPHSVARDVAAFDTLDTLNAPAARTKKIKLGTDILQVPLYQPVDLARRVVTLDHISLMETRTMRQGRLSVSTTRGSATASSKSRRIHLSSL